MPLTAEQEVELLRLLEQEKRVAARRKIDTYFPETGLLRRELYQKHLEFFKAGATYKERLFMAANRIGKTEGAGGYEVVLHLTGEYPDWWEGRRFDHPVVVWAAGETGRHVRDSLQLKLLGRVGHFGTGLIPGESIRGKPTVRQGVSDAVDTVQVKHRSGGISYLTFKSYDQGSTSFASSEIDVFWCDEEPPADVWDEGVMRLMTTDGIAFLTFTPLQGMSKVVLLFLPDGREAEEGSVRHVTSATWDDVPHLTEEQKQEELARIAPHMRDARTKGIPALGSGAIYPISESDFVVSPFDLPAFWPRSYGLDVGWNRTAAIWQAWDRGADVVYLYAEHYRGQAEPAVHSESIRAKGRWMHGVIDPASRGRGQRDGERLMQDYVDLGLNLTAADHGVESGIFEVWTRLSTGRLKVFGSLGNWLREFRLYRRNDKGAVVKEDDHAMDATRYLIVSGLEVAQTPPDYLELMGRKPAVLSDYDPVWNPIG